MMMMMNQGNPSYPNPRHELPGGIPPWRATQSTSTTSQGSKQSVPVVGVSKPEPRKASNAASSQTWPPSLKSYVERCFSACSNDAERDRMEAILRSKINHSISLGEIHTTNWTVLDIPEGVLNNNPRVSQNAVRDGPVVVNHSNSESKKEARSKRFSSTLEEQSLNKKTNTPSNVVAVDSGGVHTATIIGRSEEVEKRYLRLTTIANPSHVRPIEVLKKSLSYVLNKWEVEHDYLYFCDQMKSIRQDLTVQRVFNEFTVRVYEIHGKIVLEQNDMSEYNQCQAQLKILYNSGIKGKENEFTALGLIYAMYTGNMIEFSSKLGELSDSHLQSPEVQHALQLHCFSLLSDCSMLSSTLHDDESALCKSATTLYNSILDNNRKSSIQNLISCVRSSISNHDIARIFRFQNEQVCESFLSSNSIVIPQAISRQ